MRNGGTAGATRTDSTSANVVVFDDPVDPETNLERGREFLTVDMHSRA
jgi:hypothetical protein